MNRLIGLGAIQIAGLALRYGQLILFARLMSLAEFGVYSTIWAVVGWTSLLVVGGWSSYFLAQIPKYGMSIDDLRGAQVAMLKRFLLVAVLQSLFLLALFGRSMGSLSIAAGCLALLGMSFGNAASEAWRAFGVILWSRWLLAALPTILPASLLLGWNYAAGEPTASQALIALSLGWAAIWLVAIQGSANLARTSETSVSSATRSPSRRDFMIIKVCQGLLATGDVFVVSMLLTFEDAAVYGVATRLAVLAGFALNIVTMMYGPRISAAAVDGNRLRQITARTTRLSVYLSLPVLLALVIAREPLVSSFGSGYAEASSLLLVLLVGTGANALFGPIGTVVNVNGQEKTSRNVMLGACAVFIPGSLAATAEFGMYGAALVSSVVTLLWNLALWRTVNFDKVQHESRASA